MVIASPLVAVVLFLVGVGLIVYSAEELVETITKAAAVTGLSTFVLAIFFAGLDLENWAFGVASILGDLPGVAIGSALGSGLFLVGVAVAVGGLVTPFEPMIDRDYLLLLLASPLVLLAFIVDGTVSRLDGFALLVYRKSRSSASGLNDRENFCWPRSLTR